LLSILETHGAELYALFTRLTLNASVADDLLQELFLKLRAAEGLALANNPRAYVFRAAIHLAFDWRRARRPTEPLSAEPAAADRSPLERLIDSEELEQVLDALQHLSALGRQVIVLHYLQRQDYADIAAQVGKTEHQVRALAAKALGQLRLRLRPTSEPEKSE
jgi:RNA polymerase sigma-70 factor (ECF subfamily)